MRRFFNTVVLILLGVTLIVFAVANRHEVTVSLDPFNSRDPALGVTLPLFALIIAAAILGVVAGGCATWISQRRWRRAARLHEADARDLRAQLTDWRNNAASYRQIPNQAPALPESLYRRDKQSAAL